MPEIHNELLSLRRENSKTFKLDGSKRQLVVSVGAIHYKDNYADKTEQWKDIDLTWEGNRITKAPYELTLDGKKITLRNKKTGDVSTIELAEIGGKPVPIPVYSFSKGLARCGDISEDTDIEIVAEYSSVRFTRILKSSKAPIEAKFKVTGEIPFIVHAQDTKDDLAVEIILKDEILTEALKLDRVIKYPVRIDPTWQVVESTDDCHRRLTASDWGLTTPAISAGCYSVDPVDTYQYGGGMRFTNVTIPQGATITAAHLTFRARATYSGVNCNTRISAEDVDDALTFADDAAAFDTRWANRTTARVDWDAIPAWTVNSDYDSPEIKTVIKEIVDRGGWASGQDIVIFWEDFEDRSTHTGGALRQGYSYDGSTTYAPKLVVTYTTVAKAPTFRLDPKPRTMAKFYPSLKLG